MRIRDFLPLQQAAVRPKQASQVLPVDDQKTLSKAFKIAALAVGFNGIPVSINSRSTFEVPDIDFQRINRAIDTDSYMRQGINKYKELLWKEGWEIVSENEDAVNYLYKRIDFMEIAMGRTFQDLLIDIGDQLIRYANVFIVKSRSKDMLELFPDKLYSGLGKYPIVGYYLIPTEHVEILRDQNNRPFWYRQRRDDALAYYSQGQDFAPKWKAIDVIHMYYDKKPGRAFGTPFLASSLDDVLALRQVEEDHQNLIHRELFPLYQYKIGTDDHPATKDEIDKAEVELNSLRTEGGLIMPHRHTVEVIGADGNALDAGDFITHMKERVAISLGLFPHHLGMTGAGGNRAMTDRLDTAFYDKIKSYQRYIADCIRLYIFNEMLIEGGFDPHVHPDNTGQSDRCIFKFHEIDVDTQVKKETHELQKMTAGAQTVPETRLKLGMMPQIDEAETSAAYTARMTPPAVHTPPKGPQGGQPPPKVIDVTPKPAQKALPSGATPGISNKVRPTNQQGTRTSPNIRRIDIDLDWLKETVELLKEDEDFSKQDKDMI